MIMLTLKRLSPCMMFGSLFQIISRNLSKGIETFPDLDKKKEERKMLEKSRL
jgi:hypothetical protein